MLQKDLQIKKLERLVSDLQKSRLMNSPSLISSLKHTKNNEFTNTFTPNPKESRFHSPTVQRSADQALKSLLTNQAVSAAASPEHHGMSGNVIEYSHMQTSHFGEKDKIRLEGEVTRLKTKMELLEKENHRLKLSRLLFIYRN